MRSYVILFLSKGKLQEEGIPPFLSKLWQRAEGNARLLRTNTYAKRAKHSIVFNLTTKMLTYNRKPQAVK